MKINLHKKLQGNHLIDVFYEAFKSKAKKIIKEEMYTIEKGIEPYVVTVEVVIGFNRYSSSDSEKAYLIARLRNINVNSTYNGIDIHLDVVNSSNDIIVPDIKRMKDCTPIIEKEVLKLLKTFNAAYIKSITPKGK